MISSANKVVGRFAPSPTGPLHMGSLLCALASYLDCRANNGQWLLRIEDVDTVREASGAREQIINCLAAHGLHSDGEIIIQSQRNARYEAVLQQLQQQALCYPCTCSRKQLADFNVYPGNCRAQRSVPASPHAWRLRTQPRTICFDDAIQGPVTQALEDTGDFVLLRKDKLWAYHLAVVIDDADQGVNRVLRGIDLLDCCAPQIYLQQLLNLPRPQYAHLPVLVNASGQKLSKQTYADAVDTTTPKANLLQVLTLLQQTLPPPESQRTLADIIDFATLHWDITALAGQQHIAFA